MTVVHPHQLTSRPSIPTLSSPCVSSIHRLVVWAPQLLRNFFFHHHPVSQCTRSTRSLYTFARRACYLPATCHQLRVLPVQPPFILPNPTRRSRRPFSTSSTSSSLTLTNLSNPLHLPLSCLHPSRSTQTSNPTLPALTSSSLPPISIPSLLLLL